MRRNQVFSCVVTGGIRLNIATSCKRALPLAIATNAILVVVATFSYRSCVVTICEVCRYMFAIVPQCLATALAVNIDMRAARFKFMVAAPLGQQAAIPPECEEAFYWHKALRICQRWHTL